VRTKRKGPEALLFTTPKFPTLRVYGSVPAADGSFVCTRATFLATNVDGWNDVEFSVTGSGVWKTSTRFATLQLNAAPELKDVIGGRVKLNDTRLSGADAIDALRGRFERIRRGKPVKRDREEAPAWLELNAAWNGIFGNAGAFYTLVKKEG
jgi:hypothetical protein